MELGRAFRLLCLGGSRAFLRGRADEVDGEDGGGLRFSGRLGAAGGVAGGRGRAFDFGRGLGDAGTTERAAVIAAQRETQARPRRRRHKSESNCDQERRTV